MRSAYGLMLVLLLLIACVSARAETVYLITFDHGVMDCGPADYTAAGNEVIPADVHGVLLNCGQYPDATRRTGNLVDPNVVGPQGGQVLNMLLAGAWPNKQGYFFGIDPAANGNNYGTHTYPASGCPDPIGSEGPEVANEYTLEALVRPDYTRNPGLDFGLTNVSVIFDSTRLDFDPLGNSYGGAGLYVDQNTGLVSYNTGFPYAPFNVVTSTTALAAGQWYHIAAIARTGGAAQRTELWINGVLEGTGGYPFGWETQGLYRLPGHFTIGTQYWPMDGRNWQGQIDAVAISDMALDPTSWVVGPHIAPTSIADAKVGGESGIACSGVVTASFSGYGPGSTEYFYIEDPNRSCAIRVAKAGYFAVPGNTATVSGVVVTLPSGERQISASTIVESPGTPVAPLAMTNKALGGGDFGSPPAGQSGIEGASGLNNIGLLVRTVGITSDAFLLDPHIFALDDGSGVPLNVFVPSGILPSDGSYIDLTGISSCELWEGEIRRFIIATDYQIVL